MEGDTPLEEHGEQKVVERLAEIEGMPALPLVHAQDAVPDVAVPPDHVGPGVVHDVVRVLPLLRRARRVPFPGRGVDARIAHPVPLTVQHVVANLHVLQDLGGGEQGGPQEPCRRQDAGEEQRAATDLQAALGANHAADVARIAFAAVGDHLVADRVELAADRVDLVGGQPGQGGCHLVSPHSSMATSPAGAETQV